MALTDRIKNTLYSGIVSSLLFLTSCGGGGNPPEPLKTLSQTLVSQIDPITGYAGIEQDITSNDLPLQRNMTYEGNPFGTNPTSISNSPFHKTFSKVLRGNYSSTVNSASGKTDTKNLTVINYEPVSNCDPINIKDKYEEKISNLENCLIDPNFEDNGNLEIISANSPDGKVNVVSFNGKELILKGIPGNIGNHLIELEYGSQNGRISNSTLEVNVTEANWQAALFSSRNQGTGELYLGDVGNSLTNVVRLTNNQANDAQPYWSPDGSELLFVSNRDLKNLGIWKMSNFDGSDQAIKLTSDEISALNPVWCSDGKIYFGFVELGETGIARANPDGSGRQKIIRKPFNGIRTGNPTCSLDGSEIAFGTFEVNGEVYKANSDGSNPRNLTNNSVTDGQPRWGVDNKIYFISDRDTPGQVGEFNLFRMNPDGTGVERVTDFVGSEFDAMLFPDGKSLSFTKVPFIGAPFQIYLGEIVNGKVDESQIIQLTTQGQNRSLAIRPWPNQ